MREVQALAASSTLLATSLLAHILAGGASLSLYSGAALLALSCLIAAVMVQDNDDPFRAVVAIFIAQNFSHFILGGQPTSDTAMFMGHIAAGLVSYHLLRYFNRDLPALGTIFLRSIVRTFHSIQIPAEHRISLFNFSPINYVESYFFQAYSLRAPPLY